MVNKVVNTGLDEFLELLRTDIVALTDERNSMAEASFAKKHKISITQLVTHMWQCPDKPIHKSRAPVLDKEEVHRLRSEWFSDIEIARKFKTSNWQVWLQCWTRTQCWFVKWPNSSKNDNRIARWLNTVSWWNQKVKKESWMDWDDIVEQGQRPIWTFHSFKKWW